MRKATYLPVIFLLLPYFLSGQNLMLTTSVEATYSISDPDEIKPVTLEMPSILPLQKGFLFQWAKITSKDIISVDYEFVVRNEEGIIFSVSTKNNEFRLLREEYKNLASGEQYFAYVNARVSSETSSYTISGDRTGVKFTFEPECSAPENVRVIERGINSILVGWDGLPAQPKVLNYKLRYRVEQSSGKWNEVIVDKGTSTKLYSMESGIRYTVEVQKICYWHDGSEILSEWVSLETPAAAKLTLPSFDCGDPYTYTTPNCDSTNQVVNGNMNFSKIYLGGFPVEIQQISSDTSPDVGIVWTGTGLVPLPFGVDKFATIEFQSVVINLDSQICYTRGITVLRDVEPNLPDLTPFNGFGNAKICLPKPSNEGFDSTGIHSVTGLPWDPYGFGPNGTYIKEPPYQGYIPGFPFDTTLIYDPNGFDADGINALTGTYFNPSGCSRDSIDIYGQPCIPNIPPYSWMDTTNQSTPTAAGLAFASQVNDSLTIWLTAILNTLNGNANILLAEKEDQCDSIRNIIRSDVATAGLDSTFIYGDNNRYFAPGMHLNFSAPPQPMIPGSYQNRAPEIKDLEKQHIKLYNCDIDQYAIVYLKEVIESFLTTSGLAGLKEIILDKITKQPEATINKFINDHAFFLTWLKDQTSIEVGEKYYELHGSGTTSIEPKNIPWESDFRSICANPKGRDRSNHSTTGFLSTADNAFLGQLLEQAAEVRYEDLNFEYQQGFKMINGVHRAFYLEAITQARNAAGGLTQANPNLQPIELLTYGEDGKGFRVYLDNIQFYTDQPATADAFIVIDIPYNGQRIVFEAIEVPFTPKGLLTENGVKLTMANDFPIRLTNNARLTLKGDTNTYVVMNCLGYAGMGISGEVELCRNVVKPIDPVTKKVLPDPRMVTGHFTTILSSFSSLYVSFVVDPFVVTGAEEVKWKVDTIILDLSETKSPLGSPPPGYATPLAGAWGFSPLWRGFYAKEIEVTLPTKFRKDTTPIIVGVNDLVIDNMGVSCSVFAENLLPLNQGNADGWGLSVDNFELTVLMSNISKAEFEGKIHVPLFKNSESEADTLRPEDCFNYLALIRPNSGFQFTAFQQPEVVYSADMWRAGTVDITSSVLDMTFANDSFNITASVCGSVAIDTNLTENVPVNIPPITFEGVQVSNRAPYFSPGTWGFPIQIGAKFTGFELGISGIQMAKTLNEEPLLNFNAHIQISDDTTAIKATGGFGLVGELVVVNGEQNWKFKRLEVHDIDINGSFPGLAIHGFAKFFRGDSIFGTGFRGGLEAKFGLMKSEVSVVGQFGRVQGMKYFMVDAMYCAGPGNGVNILGAFELNAIGGGAYYHMSRSNYAYSSSACDTPIPTALGASLSGIIYRPTDTVSLGIKLTVGGGTVGTPEAFNLNASLEFQFNTNGGLDKIWLNGNGKFMAPLELDGLPTFVKNQLPNNTAAVKANVDILLDFENQQLTGTLETYMNVAGVLRGIDPVAIDRVCFAQLKISEQEWYIKIGGPADSSRAGIKVVIPGMKEPAYIFRTYLQIGNGIDPLPPLPADILAALNKDKVDNQYGSDRNSTLDGFAFGVDVQLGGSFKFLVLYADMNAHFGFDVNIAKTTPPMLCNGNEFGINGWYAQGQIYAALGVKMGLEVKVFGSTKKFEIMNVQVGAALEAKLPNPFWAHGAVAYSYNLLNGLVKGSGDFDFEVGEKCVFSSEGSLADVPVILHVRPDQGASKVSVGSLPSAVFNFAVDQPFSFEELGGPSVSFKITLDTAKLYWRGYEIPIEKLIWSQENKQVNLKPISFLPGNDTIRFLVSVHIDSNGITIGHERRDIWFTTGEGMRTIPTYNVKGSYPLDGQYNYYKNELTNNKGYIQLDRAQPDVMIGQEQYIKVVRFRESGGECQFAKLEFSVENFWDKKLEFPLPENSFFESNKVYELQIVDFPKDDPNWGSDYSGPAPCICNGCIPPTITPPTPPFGGLITPTLAISSAGEGTPAPPPSSSSTNTPVTERLVYSAYFRVSEYGRFADKMEALQNSFPQTKNGDAPEIEITSIEQEFDVNLTVEPFDWCDLKYMEREVALLTYGLTLPHSHFATGVPSIYFYPVLHPDETYYLPLPGGYITTSLPFGFKSEPQKAIFFSPSNSTNLRVIKNHYINGLPANFAGPQTLKVSVVKALKDGAQGFINSLAAYENNQWAELNNLYECTAYENICSCEGLIESQDYHTFYVLRCLTNSEPTLGVKSYPLKFRYQLPGLGQWTGDFYNVTLNH